MVKIHTNYGVITLTLLADKAPITVANFLDYVKEGFYDNTIFHRVIDGFMIQAEDLNRAWIKKKVRRRSKTKPIMV